MAPHEATIELNAIAGSLDWREGLPRPNWIVVDDWFEKHVPQERRNDAWTQLARNWIDVLGSAIGNGYCQSESQEFFLLSKRDRPSSDRMLAWCEYARHTILQALDGVTRSDGFGKHVVLDFNDADAYYDYISDFYPEEGDFGLSGGMFIADGYSHIAIHTARGDEYAWILAHELSHNLLRHLPLPLWLDEGITQVLEATVVGRSTFTVNREIVSQHRGYWNSETIQQFWSGQSFYSSDEGQELSYHLAQALFRNLAADYRKQLPAFLNAANATDAGGAALESACGVSLCDRVAQFLGPGDWTPRV